jgi:hypothetical protein
MVLATTANLTVSIYAITLGGSSGNRLLFGLGIAIGLIFAAAFGNAVARPPQAVVLGVSHATPALIALLLLVLVHSLERYNRHVVDRTPFWEFNGGANAG